MKCYSLSVIFDDMDYQNDWIDLIESKNLIYFASEISNFFGITDEQHIREALSRSISAIKQSNLPQKLHFRRIFIEKNGSVVEDWVLSEIAWKLTILNLPPVNSTIARMQMKLIKNF